nr:MAG TPA: hypothetical protein [Caudoviricetes sp.]
MFKSEVARATNSNIEPVKITLAEAFNTRLKRFECRTLKVAMQFEEIEKQAKKLLPIFQAELEVREQILDKKVQMWSKEEYKDFEDYFTYKYVNLKEIM